MRGRCGEGEEGVENDGGNQRAGAKPMCSVKCFTRSLVSSNKRMLGLIKAPFTIMSRLFQRVSNWFRTNIPHERLRNWDGRNVIDEE